MHNTAESTNYKAKLYDILYNPWKYNLPPETLKNLRMWRGLFVWHGEFATQKNYKMAAEALLCGDPKNRSRRSVMLDIKTRQADVTKKERGYGK